MVECFALHHPSVATTASGAFLLVQSSYTEAHPIDFNMKKEISISQKTSTSSTLLSQCDHVNFLSALFNAFPVMSIMLISHE